MSPPAPFRMLVVLRAALGAGLVVRSPSIIALAVLFLLLVHLLVRLYEEPVLASRFGDPYLRYKSSVHRWLPRFPRSSAARDAG